MEYKEFNPDISKEGLEKVAQISVLKEFDMNRKAVISRELLAALEAKGGRDLIDSYLVEADAEPDGTEE